MDPGVTASRNDLVLTGFGSEETVTENGNITTTKSEELEEKKNNSGITYGIDDNPPWYLCIFIALQHYLTMIGSIVSIPFILTPALCMRDDDPARSEIVCTMIFVTGLVTWFQATFGCRLPIVQGGTISFLVPTLAILNLPQWRCPEPEIVDAMTPENRTELWQIRMRELSGAIAVSAIFQLLIGLFGIVGMLLKYITPLTIVPTVSLVGLSLFENAARAASQHWGIAAGTIMMVTLFSQLIREVHIPVPGYSFGKGFRIIWFQLFKLFPVLLTILLMWGVCGMMTHFEHLPVGHPARTDIKLKIIEQSPWFRLPYPGQWGIPTVTAAGVLGMLAGVLACTVESISFYPTTARMCVAPPPPVHAINRGIAIEGLGTILAGIWGSGNGTNTFGENVAAIGVTKIGSRRVIQYASFLMIFLGLTTKIGAVFIIIPQPVVGGMFCVMFGIIVAFGLSALQYVDMNSSRNLFVVGFSIFFSLVLPKWMQAHPHSIQTGNEIVDSIITVLLSTSIMVGGITGCLLDNFVPGTPEERGLIKWQKEIEFTSNKDDADIPSTYDFPVGMGFLKRYLQCQRLFTVIYM
ncbi:hypothetical protein ANN_12007 [Periplaneta americana]|uniref:Solute carrier family 23 member 1 n=1 Tax=Periplaneta americana TaxID=6978 RepID=A0ABQ8T845_PERAM|nr:hypothetical protein ANN_12007 [Periplaneta americana]